MNPVSKFKIQPVNLRFYLYPKEKKPSELTIDILTKYKLLENYVNQISVNKQTTQQLSVSVISHNIF